VQFNDVIEDVGVVIDAAGAAVIVVGSIGAGVLAARQAMTRSRTFYRNFRQRLGKAILLGLELFVAADIIRTVATTPNLTSVAVLAGIVAIRTFLSFSLEVEVSGRWPWQKSAELDGHASDRS
jgi:uncharacterized membrane protein